MKKIFSLAACAALMLACSQTDNDQQIAPQTIGFDIAATRAEIADADAVYDNGFKCSIYWNGNEIYNNIVAEWNGQGFVSNPQAYWPQATESRPCLFRAVSSTRDIELSHNDGKTSFDYTLATSAAEQEDLLVASATAVSVPDNGVQRLPFTHAMTKVNFTVYVEDQPVNEGYIWRLSSIAIETLDRGTYTFDTTMPWKPAGEKTPMEYLGQEEEVDLVNAGSWVGNNNLMLIPQDGKNVDVTLTWQVFLVRGGEEISVSTSPARRTYTVTTEKWVPNASVRYANLRLPNIGENTDGNGADDTDDNNMKPIEYDPEHHD